MRGEPAALGVPAWAFAAAFLVYAVLLSPLDEYGVAVRLVLTGVIPILIGLFHLIAPHHGGFYMPVVYATLAFGVGDTVDDSGVVTLDDHDGHPNIRSLVDDNYEIITF